MRPTPRIRFPKLPFSPSTWAYPEADPVDVIHQPVEDRIRQNQNQRIVIPLGRNISGQALASDADPCQYLKESGWMPFLVVVGSPRY